MQKIHLNVVNYNNNVSIILKFKNVYIKIKYHVMN